MLQISHKFVSKRLLYGKTSDKNKNTISYEGRNDRPNPLAKLNILP